MEGTYAIREGERQYWKGETYVSKISKADIYTLDEARKAVSFHEGLEWEIVNVKSLGVELAWNLKKSPVFDVPPWVAALPWLDSEYEITVNVKRK